MEMRTALMLLGGCLALAACDVTSDRPDQVVPAGGASATPAPGAQTAASAAATSGPTAVAGGQGKGQPGPSSAPAAALPTVLAPPPTPVPTLAAQFNDHDADNVNGAFDPGRSDGDGQG